MHLAPLRAGLSARAGEGRDYRIFAFNLSEQQVSFRPGLLARAETAK
jgi:hypothetical protein